MELVSWKTQNKDTNKVSFSIKIWEKYRNTKKTNVIEISAKSKFRLMLKVVWFLIKNYKKI